jgi:lysophospholipase L1-like esterase
MLLRPRERLIFIGDSITDCGRRRPVGEGPYAQALGDGYVSLVDSALTAAYPDYEIHVVNMGVAGNTIRDLRVRWRSDVLEMHPSWLAIMIGINDVWRRFDPPMLAEQAISTEEYVETLESLIQQARPSLLGLILMTPYLLEKDRGEPMRALMDQFGAAMRHAAEKHNAVFVDTQAAFDVVLRWLQPAQLAEDRIHVNQAGHAILARALLHQIGYDWGRLQAQGIGAPGSMTNSGEAPGPGANPSGGRTR